MNRRERAFYKKNVNTKCSFPRTIPLSCERQNSKWGKFFLKRNATKNKEAPLQLLELEKADYLIEMEQRKKAFLFYCEHHAF